MSFFFHNQDVMTSQESVDYCHHKMIQQTSRMRTESINSPSNSNRGNNDLTPIQQNMAKYLVKEALRRGSMDNISVIVVWLSSAIGKADDQLSTNAS